MDDESEEEECPSDRYMAVLDQSAFGGDAALQCLGEWAAEFDLEREGARMPSKRVYWDVIHRLGKDGISVRDAKWYISKCDLDGFSKRLPGAAAMQFLIGLYDEARTLANDRKGRRSRR